MPTFVGGGCWRRLLVAVVGDGCWWRLLVAVARLLVFASDFKLGAERAGIRGGGSVRIERELAKRLINIQKGTAL
jgi:hypothetical protein